MDVNAPLSLIALDAILFGGVIFGIYVFATSWLAVRMSSSRPADYTGTPYILQNSGIIVAVVVVALLVLVGGVMLKHVSLKLGGADSEHGRHRGSSAFEPLVHITIHRH